MKLHFRTFLISCLGALAVGMPVYPKIALVSDRLQAPSQLCQHPVAKNAKEAASAHFIASFPRQYFEGNDSDGSITHELGEFTADSFVQDLRSQFYLDEQTFTFSPRTQTYFFVRSEIYYEDGKRDENNTDYLWSYRVGDEKAIKLSVLPRLNSDPSFGNYLVGMGIDEKQNRLYAAWQCADLEVIHSFDLSKNEWHNLNSSIENPISGRLKSMAYSAERDMIFELRCVDHDKFEKKSKQPEHEWYLDTLSTAGKLLSHKPLKGEIAYILERYQLSAAGRYLVLYVNPDMGSNPDDQRDIRLLKRSIKRGYLTARTFVIDPDALQITSAHKVPLPELKAEDTGKEFRDRDQKN